MSPSGVVYADSSPTAVLFPGQGSQDSSQRLMVKQTVPKLLRAAVTLSGADPFGQLGNGTSFVQTAIFLTSYASWLRLEEQPIAMAGHSVGELAALTAAGAFEASDALELVLLRGKLMQKCVVNHFHNGMLAVRGGELEQVSELAQNFDLVVSSDNAPLEQVVSGGLTQLQDFQSAVRAQGLKSMLIPAPGAFHSPLMQAAVERFRDTLNSVAIGRTSCTVISNVTARPFDDIVNELSAALVSRVRWCESLCYLKELGTQRFVEVEPGKILTGLVKRTLCDVDAFAVTTCAN